MKAFTTPDYAGLWLPFSGDRTRFREQLQIHLQTALHDAHGKLTVDSRGPHWQGSAKINLSYSHSVDQGLLVYSKTHTLGVDIERKDRKFSQDPLVLATRFFHESEASVLKATQPEERPIEFLKLWVKKEAYAKWTRDGISQTLNQKLPKAEVCLIRYLPICVDGFLGAVAVQEVTRE